MPTKISVHFSSICLCTVLPQTQQPLYCLIILWFHWLIVSYVHDVKDRSCMPLMDQEKTSQWEDM